MFKAFLKTASAIIGLLWGLWHLPAFLIPWTTQHGLPVMLLLIHDIAFAILLTWIFNNTRGSIWMAMLAHASLNLTISILPVTPAAAGSTQPLIFAIGLLYLAAFMALVLSGPKTLTRVPAHP